MVAWIPYPFVRIVAFFIAGIILGIYLPDVLPERIVQLLLIAFVVLYFYLFFIQRKRESLLTGIIGLTCIVVGGYVHLLAKTDSRHSDHFMYADSIEFYKAVVTNQAQEKERSWKLETKLLERKTNGEWKKCSGNVVVYLPKEDFQYPFQYGDVLLVKGNPQAMQPPSNPGEFDYERFLTFRKIYHQHLLKKESVHLLENDPPNYFLYYSIQARIWADSTLKANVRGEREQAVASALVLGVTDGLDNELLNAYSATGALHVLAVSGLHVSIIYLILLLLFKPLTKLKSGKWILAVLSLIILWGYAFVTGLSPSVLRAVAMFSVVALARPLNQRTNIFNTLAVSAFALLLYEPYLIMSVGFQLSYLAVIGIVYVQPMLYQAWEPQSKIWDEVWKITTVSIAAQLATCALGLLYFHQFPNYFLVSNLFVIPGSFGVLVLGLVVLAIGFLHPVAHLLGIVLEWLIKALNVVVFTVEDLPFSLVENIYINTFQCWLIMILIISFILLIEKKRFQYLILSTCLSFIIAFVSWIHFNRDVNTSSLTVYNVAHHSAIDLTNKGQTFFYTDSTLYNDTEKLRFHIRPNRLMGGVEHIEAGYAQNNVHHKNGCTLITWNQHSILIVNSKTYTLPTKMKVDYLIISNNAPVDFLTLTGHITAKKIIMDSSNSFYYATKVLKQAHEIKKEVHSVLHQGAFTIKTQKKQT